MKKSGKKSRVGIFRDFVKLTTRTEGPHGGASYVRGAKRSRIDRHRGRIERLVGRALVALTWGPMRATFLPLLRGRTPLGFDSRTIDSRVDSTFEAWVQKRKGGTAARRSDRQQHPHQMQWIEV